MALWIVNTGAQRFEIERGIHEAKAVFKAAHVAPERAYQAFTKYTPGGDGLDSLELGYALAWAEAERKALAACCRGWAVIPKHAALEP